jgi:hypothetical protein
MTELFLGDKMKFKIVGEIEAQTEEEARFAATIQGGHDYLNFIEKANASSNYWRMTEVSKDMAQYLFNCGREVFQIHNHFDSSSESLCTNLDDIMEFDGIFAIER